MTRSGGFVYGFLAASLVPPVAIALTSPVGGQLSAGVALVTFAFILPLSIAAVTVLGLPAYLLLRRYAPWRWWWVLVVGFILGLPVAVAVHLPSPPAFRSCLYYGLIGAVTALAFWLIWRRGQTTAEDARPENERAA